MRATACCCTQCQRLTGAFFFEHPNLTVSSCVCALLSFPSPALLFPAQLEVVCKKPLTKKWKKDPKLRIQQIENINCTLSCAVSPRAPFLSLRRGRCWLPAF